MRDSDFLAGFIIGFLLCATISLSTLSILVHDKQIITREKLVKEGLAHYKSTNGEFIMHLNKEEDTNESDSR